MPPSHYVRSSDWVETKCFRSKVAQSQTHSWPHLKSKHLFIHKQITQNIFLIKEFFCMICCHLCLSPSGRRQWSSCYLISLTRKRMSLPLSVLFTSSSHCLRPGDQRTLCALCHYCILLWHCRDITCRAAQCYENIQSKHIECCHMQYDLQYVQKYFKGKK